MQIRPLLTTKLLYISNAKKYSDFFSTLYNTALSATPQIPLCRRMVGSNLGRLFYWLADNRHWLSDTALEGIQTIGISCRTRHWLSDNRHWLSDAALHWLSDTALAVRQQNEYIKNTDSVLNSTGISRPCEKAKK
jgi:hypothetical protein